jgi:hypothetical protein
MHGYPETIVIRHLMAQPARSARDARPEATPVRTSLALVAVITAFLLVAGLAFAYVSLLTSGDDSTPQAVCAVKIAGHGASKCG